MKHVFQARRQWLGRQAPALLATCGLGLAPLARAASPAALPPVFVLNSAEATVSLVDQVEMREIRRFAVGKEPHHLYPTPDGKTLIVANAVSNDLHLVDPVTAMPGPRIRQIDDPYQLAFSPDRRWFVTAALRLDRVDVYAWDGQTKKLVRRIAAPRAPSHLWFSDDSRWVFVTLQDSNEIAAIDLQRLEIAWRLPVGQTPAGILLSPDGRLLFVGIMGQDVVEVIDWAERKIVARIVTGKGAHNFRGLGDRRHLLVSNRVANTVSVLDMHTLKVTAEFAVAGGPDCMEVTADARQLWVTQRFAGRVAVLELPSGKMIRSIRVGRSPHGIYMHNRAALV